MSKKSNKKELTIHDQTTKDIMQYLPEHKKMLTTINKNYPEIHRATSLFGKSQSQFMDNMLTVAHPTPLRNARQILAEINKTKAALQEAYFKNKKEEVRLRMLERDLESEKDPLKAELLEVKIQEKFAKLESGKTYISGAIRKMTNYIEQYNSILKKHNKTDFNEIDFEKEEERYHIMKAFEQGLCAARSHGGVIDEGNQIYLYQVGVNGAAAQQEVRKYLIKEGKLISEGGEPSHAMLMEFLEDMADKYQGSAKEFAEHKGMTGKITKKATLLEGDTRLLLQDKKKK